MSKEEIVTPIQADRDAIARIVDPAVFKDLDAVRRELGDWADDPLYSGRERVDAAFVKADEILARISHTRTPDTELVGALTDVGAHLAAAVSILKRAHAEKVTPAKVAPSDRMFRQMLKDYEASLERGRAALNAIPHGQQTGEGSRDE